MINSENILLVGSVLLFFSIVFSKTGFKFGVPTLLVFLLVGMGFGTDGLGIEFSSAKDAQFIGMVALSIILFSGGMDTKIESIRPVLTPGIMLSTAGVLITTMLTGGFIYFISGLSKTNIELGLMTSMLLAATMSSTDSASVFNILKSQRMNLKYNLRPLLELESGSNDPMAIMLTLVLIQVIAGGSELDALPVVRNLIIQFAVGGLLGFLMGKFATWILNKINLPNGSLYPILLLSLVFMTFIFTDLLSGNGYLAVYIAGIVVGNYKLAYRKEINTFMNGLTWLFQIIMFLTLGLLVNPHEMLGVALVAILIAIFMVLVARPISVFACLLPFKEFPIKAKAFVSWVGLRGAAPIIFATYPVIAGIEGANIIFNVVFFITLLSLLIQGMTIGIVAKKLHLDLPAEKEGNEFGIELPDEIDSQLEEITVTETMLGNGNRLMDMQFKKGQLVMIIKRDDKFIVPHGQLELMKNDKLLLIKQSI
ncbi:MAG: potassium/proton antiporter [Bacteroidaceae bacterium]|nr:potassium/proton antiporter [Bacteroidaceae bacterium]